MSMAEQAAEKRAKKPKTRKTESQRLAAHRAHCANSEDRKRDAGLERLTVWIPQSMRGHFKTLASAACNHHLRHPDSHAAAPISAEIVPQSPREVSKAENPTLVIAVAPRKPSRNKAAKPDPRQLSLFETPIKQEGVCDGEGR